MENGQLHDDKLFRAVHDRLSDYEAPSNGADWDAMSRSLDNLPKSARYKWKISLNSILVIFGLVGISALSYALVTKKGNAPDSKTTQATVTTPVHSQQQKNVNTTTGSVNSSQTTAPVQNSFANANEAPIMNVSIVSIPGVTANGNDAKTDASSNSLSVATDGSVKSKRKNKNQLLFGDQIDPKKGFIYNTRENPNVMSAPFDPAPNVFYDSENGQIKKIEIKRDSASARGPRRSKTDSTANIFSPGVPTEGGPAGFDTE
ncbi:MAG: hypothetical protein ABIQ40_14655 [Bacteroidia bacterium]